MVMYLLDTNIISELERKNPNPQVWAWAKKIKEDRTAVFLSVLTLGEIRKGALKIKDPAQSKRILALLETVESQFAGMILPVTSDVAHEWGRLLALDATNPIDALFAATASVHGLMVATRNEKHFKPFGVALVNPFAE
jgi:predicted nucleic acid-binding protein